MKKKLIILFLIIAIKSNAIVIWGSTWVIPQNYGCDNASQYVQVGFSTSSEINNDRYQIMRSTDPTFSSAIYVGAPISGCGTCGGRTYSATDYGPFIPGAVYYYQVEATSNSSVTSDRSLGTYTNNVPTTVNWINQVTSSFESSSTPNTESSYTWAPETRSTQGANIDLIQTEVAKVYIEQNNNKLNFIIPSSFPFVNLDVNIDNAGYFNIYNGSSVTNVEWSNSASYFTGIGSHQLFVNFTEATSGTIFHREYTIYVVPKSDAFYKDNYCNTIRVWKNPSGTQGIPLLLSEGFDAYNTKPEQYYRQAGKDLIDCLLKKGFDIYVINYKYNSQDIRNNAADFSSAIRYVSSINNNLPIIAAGMSMGGIINRYACAKAENDGLPLPISKIITLDSPHQGAVVSSTLQDYKKAHTASGDTYAENATDNDAGKELLNYNAYDPTATVHNTFYSELYSLNGDGYPHLVPKIGVSFSSAAPNPNTGAWLHINVGVPAGSYSSDISLTPEEQVAGSFLPAINIDPYPVIFPDYWSDALLSSVRPYLDPTITITQYQNPTFIPHTSSLDIIAGVSKFDVVIQTAATSYHDIIPSDIIEPIINALINKDLYLQNETITDTRNYIASNTITAGNNITTTVPIGNYILASTSIVTMTAGNQITLSDGFSVLTGSNLDAKIDQVYCDGVQSTQFRHSQTNSTNETVYDNNDVINREIKITNQNESQTVIKSYALRIYPNPTENYFIVETDILPKQISVYNNIGTEIIENSTIESQQTKIDLTAQPVGIYLIKIIGFDGKITTQKIIKQ